MKRSIRKRGTPLDLKVGSFLFIVQGFDTDQLALVIPLPCIFYTAQDAATFCQRNSTDSILFGFKANRIGTRNSKAKL